MESNILPVVGVSILIFGPPSGLRFERGGAFDSGGRRTSRIKQSITLIVEKVMLLFFPVPRLPLPGYLHL